MNPKSLAWHVNIISPKNWKHNFLDPENTENGLFYKLQENDIHFGFIPFEIFFDSENDWAKVLVQIGILSLRLDWSDPASSELECRY